ncbi:MAG TPA: preprotein translocase subunit SecY [Clostridia bacterium]|nr:preprotein translocase subunit SecY [Clostridia bacterium]
MFKTIANAFRDKEIRKRILLTLLMLAIFRLGAYIPIPGLDVAALNAENSITDGSFFGIIAAINGTFGSQGTIFSLGIMPFINSFIIMQLVTIIVPKLERMSKEGEEGRKKITQITRYVAIALAVVQAFGFVMSWGDNFTGLFGTGVANKWLSRIMTVIILTAGSTFVMWLGERITEYGIGNGTSLIIFIGILSGIGSSLINAIQTMAGQSGDTSALMGSVWWFIGFILFVIVLFFFIVYVDMAERRIPVRYAKQVKGNKMYGGQTSNIPMKVNASGVMPIIFASSFLMFPQMIASFWEGSDFYNWYARWLGVNGYIYIPVLCLLILFFSYFYAQIQFNPIEVSKNIQQYGGFIPGIRPGKPTSEYLAKINNRITLFGAIFLAIIALIPSILVAVMPQELGLTNAFSATGLLIVVSVALETNKQMESQIMMKTYKGFLK